MNEEKLATGIASLDGILNGGIYKGTNILVKGGTGTGKTTVAMQYLIQGARLGEKGMYLTFEESSQQIQRFTSKFFPDQKSHIESSMIQIVDFSPQASQRSKSRVIDGQKVVIPQKENVDSVAYIEDKILDIRGQTIQRVAIDGLQTFASTFFDLSGKSDEEELRRILSRILVMLKDEGITTYLLSEEHDEETDKYAFINFTVDGVIMLKVNEALDIRTLKIMKMRGTGHTLKPVVIRFVEGTGII